MGRPNIAPIYVGSEDEGISAPLTGADFSLKKAEALEDYPAAPEIAGVFLENEPTNSRGMYIDTVCGIHEFMKGLLNSQRDRYERHQTAAWYAREFHSQLDFDHGDMSPDHQSANVVSRLYLSAVEAHSTLGMFIEAGRWCGRKSEESQEAKLIYLESRKIFQEDLDEYLAHFNGEKPDTYLEVLMDIVNMARLAVRRRSFVDAESDTDTFIFVGSTLSEFLIKNAMQRNGLSNTRYADENEEVTPIHADVVDPDNPNQENGYLQVKMKWKKDKPRFQIKPKKDKADHVIVPMKYLRPKLKNRERRKLKRYYEDLPLAA